MVPVGNPWDNAPVGPSADAKECMEMPRIPRVFWSLLACTATVGVASNLPQISAAAQEHAPAAAPAAGRIGGRGCIPTSRPAAQGERESLTPEEFARRDFSLPGISSTNTRVMRETAQWATR